MLALLIMANGKKKGLMDNEESDMGNYDDVACNCV